MGLHNEKYTLFFKSCNRVKFFVIEKSSEEIILNNCYHAEMDETSLSCRVRLSDKIKVF